MEDSIPANAVCSLSEQIPPYDITSVKKFEKAYKWTLTVDDKFVPRWTRGVTLVQIERTPLAKGNVYTCYKLHDVAHPDSQYIAKFGAANRVSRNVYFNMVIVQATSEKCAEIFNRASPSHLKFNSLFVLELVERNHLNNVCVGAPYLSGDEKKLDASTDPEDEEYKLVQAFGHYTLHKSNNEVLVSGLQRIGDKYVNTEIHTKSGKGFFDKNHGSPAFQQFAESHKCNNYCKGLKLEPLTAAQMAETTSTISQVKNGPVKINMSSNLIRAAAEKTSEKSTFVSMQKTKYLQSTTNIATVVDDSSLSGVKYDLPKSPPPVRPAVAPKFFFPPKSPSNSDLKAAAGLSTSPLAHTPTLTATPHSTSPTTPTATTTTTVTTTSTITITPTAPKTTTTAEKPAAAHAPASAHTTPPATAPIPIPSKEPAQKSTTTTTTATTTVAHHEAPHAKDHPEPLKEKIIEDMPDSSLIIEEFDIQYMQITALEPSELDDAFFDEYDEDEDDYFEEEILPMPPLPAKPSGKPILKKVLTPNKTRRVRWIDLVEYDKTSITSSTEIGGGVVVEETHVTTVTGSFDNKPSGDQWDFNSFRMLNEVKGAQVECICGDDSFLYTGSNEGHVAIWDQDLKVTSTFRAHNKAVRSVVLSNSTLFTGSADAAISSWDINTKKQINKATSKSDIHALCVSEAHSLLFSAENDKTVKVWDAHTLQHVKTLTGHNRAVKALFVMGNYLFSGSNDQQVFIWNLNTHRVVKGLVGHEGWIRTIHALGSTLYTGSQDETVRLWDLNSTECFHIIQAKGPVQALLPTSHALFSAAGDHIQVWNTGETSYPCVNDLNNRSPVLCMYRKQNQLLCGSITSSLKVWTWD